MVQIGPKIVHFPKVEHSPNVEHFFQTKNVPLSGNALYIKKQSLINMDNYLFL